MQIEFDQDCLLWDRRGFGVEAEPLLAVFESLVSKSVGSRVVKTCTLVSPTAVYLMATCSHGKNLINSTCEISTIMKSNTFQRHPLLGILV